MADTSPYDFHVRVEFPLPSSEPDTTWGIGVDDRGDPFQFCQEMRVRAYLGLQELWKAHPGASGTILVPQTDEWAKHLQAAKVGAEAFFGAAPPVAFNVVREGDPHRVVGTITETSAGYVLLASASNSKPYTLEFRWNSSELPVPKGFEWLPRRLHPVVRGWIIKRALKSLSRGPSPPEPASIGHSVMSDERQRLISVAREMLSAQRRFITSLGYEYSPTRLPDGYWGIEGDAMTIQRIPDWLDQLGEDMRPALEVALTSAAGVERASAIERLRAGASAEQDVFVVSDGHLVFEVEQPTPLVNLATRRLIFDGLLLEERRHREEHGLMPPGHEDMSSRLTGISEFAIRHKVDDFLNQHRFSADLEPALSAICADPTRSTPEYLLAIGELRCWAEREGCLQGSVWEGRYDYPYPGHSYDVYALMDHHKAADAKGRNVSWNKFWGRSEKEIARLVGHRLLALSESGDAAVAADVTALRGGPQHPEWGRAVERLSEDARSRIFQDILGSSTVTELVE